jgi:hypothetical protein
VAAALALKRQAARLSLLLEAARLSLLLRGARLSERVLGRSTSCVLGTWGGWMMGIRYGLVGVVLAALLAGDGVVERPVAVAEPEFYDRLPRDRDDRAVVAGLGELDPCALLAAGPRVSGLELRRLGAHRCGLVNGQGQPQVEVELGEEWGHVQRYHSTRSTVGGFKAYVDGMTEPNVFCWVRLPVSFRRVITFDVALWDRPDLPACQLAREFATTGVATLVTARGSGPLQGWNACTLMRLALGDEAPGYTLAGQSIDACGAKVLGSREKASDLALRFGPSDFLRGQAGPLTPERHPTRLSDRDAAGCTWGWTTDGTSALDRVVVVDGRDCARVERLARSARTVLSLPRQPVQPQRPLLYRPDDSDSAHDGACVDYPVDEGSCQPYAAGPTPPGTIELSNDASALCGSTVGPAGKHFPGLSPIVAYNTCVFVEPGHKIQLKITTEPPTQLQPDPYSHEEPMTLDGHPGLLDKGFNSFAFIHLKLLLPGGILRADLENLTSQDLTPALLATFTEVLGTYFTRS